MSDLRDLLYDIEDRHGELTPDIVLDEARPEDSPLHSRFEWDDAVAGESWRRHQAHELIQSVKVVYKEATDTDPAQRIRAFHAVRTEKGYAFRRADRIAHDPVAREVLLRDMEREWQQLKRRYSEFSEFLAMVRSDVEGEVAA